MGRFHYLGTSGRPGERLPLWPQRLRRKQLTGDTNRLKIEAGEFLSSVRSA
jgi:hypothetical protein